MPFIITDPCIDTKDTACVDVCPVDCIHPRKDEPEFAQSTMLYIHPEECIDCGACVPACPVAAIYESPDATPHNLLLVQSGSEDTIGNAANEMAKLPDAFEKMDFIPKSDQILHATKMLKQNQAETLRFHAPKQPGRYPYICSFPGHYLVMRGVMVVE